MIAITSTKGTRPIFAARRLGHVNLIVDELNRSTDFYNQVCGLALEFSETGLKANFLGTGRNRSAYRQHVQENELYSTQLTEYDPRSDQEGTQKRQPTFRPSQ